MTTSFWKHAAASLPPEIRYRYAAEFEAAGRFEQVLDRLVGAWGRARRALAKSCEIAARALRAAARILDAAARRLSLTY